MYFILLKTNNSIYLFTQIITAAYFLACSVPFLPNWFSVESWEVANVLESG